MKELKRDNVMLGFEHFRFITQIIILLINLIFSCFKIIFRKAKFEVSVPEKLSRMHNTSANVTLR